MVRLYDERSKLTSRLSLGMRKKLAIAAAFLGTPGILFLDEALNGVDIESVFQIKSELKDFVSRGGTIILSTHALEGLEKICDRYIILKRGEIVADLDADEISGSTTIGQSISLEKYVIDILND